MPVALVLSVALSFWGVPQGTVTWDWGSAGCAPKVQGYAVYGSRHVSICRWWWDRLPARRKCYMLIHEVGHAVFSYDHEDTGIMRPLDDGPMPGTCIRNWRTGAPARP